MTSCHRPRQPPTAGTVNSQSAWPQPRPGGAKSRARSQEGRDRSCSARQATQRRTARAEGQGVRRRSRTASTARGALPRQPTGELQRVPCVIRSLAHALWRESNAALRQKRNRVQAKAPAGTVADHGLEEVLALPWTPKLNAVRLVVADVGSGSCSPEPNRPNRDGDRQRNQRPAREAEQRQSNPGRYEPGNRKQDEHSRIVPAVLQEIGWRRWGETATATSASRQKQQRLCAGGWASAGRRSGPHTR